MNSSTSSTGALIGGDIAVLCDIARIQGDVGAQPLTQTGLTDFMAQLNALSYTDYAAAANPQVTGWADLLYTAVMNYQTCYNVPITGLYIAYNYGNYVAGNYEAWYEISGETYLNFMGLNAGYSIPGWTMPTHSSAWSQAVSTLANVWNNGGWPSNVIASQQGMSQSDEVNFEANLFNPSQWTDASSVIGALQALWTSQDTALQALIQQETLATNDAVLVLFLLMSQVNSAAQSDKNTAYQTANTSATSPENPNDTLIDQLAYFFLMALADPLGSFSYTYSQLTATLNALVPAVTNQDPGSQLIQATLTRQAKILASDQSYPMQDPYNPSIGFTTRQTDTLYAINQAWKTLSSASTVMEVKPA